MGFFNKWSLRLKVIAMVTFIIALLGFGSWNGMRQLGNSYGENVMNSFETYAEKIGNALEVQFYERYGDVQAFALNPNVNSLDSKKIPADLDAYVALYGIYDLIIVVDKHGKYVGSNTKDTSGKEFNLKALSEFDFSTTPWFKAAINGEFTEDKARGYSGTFFEELHDDPIAKAVWNEDKVMTGFTTTIKDKSGTVIGIVSNRTSTKWVDYQIASAYETLRKTQPSVMISLVNKDGLTLSDIRELKPDQKAEVVYDRKNIFRVLDMKKNHIPAGELLASGKTGAILSKEGNDPSADFDVVGYYNINGPKWPSSVQWGVMVHNDFEESLSSVHLALKNFYMILGAFTFIALAIAIFFGIALAKSMNGLTQILAKNSKDVSEASRKIADSSTELSEASTEQAAALQETVAAVDEISAMVDKNAESANKSRETSNNSRHVAEKGKSIVSNMLRAIDDIDHSNEEVSSQMETSNRQLGEITKLINDIGSKTKVINEIVFQTKLLSFNASVEAARAGEYGKGFAVVAEEVGNLAQMSGNAAREITDLLEQSVRRVETIVEDSKSKVEKLMTVSREKVKTGSDTAHQCNQALEEILHNVASVDSLVSEIATASHEQASGIREISKAVGQMEIVIQKNSAVAQDSSVAAEQLSGQSEELKSIVDNLVHLVQGSNAQVTAIHEGTGKNTKTSNNRVIKYEAKKRSAPAVAMKKAAGSDFTPSQDDPGFNE